MARRVIDVFLSSTAMDLAEYRKAVHERLMRTGLFHCVRQEDFGAQNAGAVEFCRQEAQEADMFVGLIGLRRGWEPDGDNQMRSITEMEHDWARDAGRPRYIWVSPDDFPVPATLRESDELHARQIAFRKRMMSERIVSQKGFASPDLLAAEVVERLMVQVVTSDLLKLIRPEAALPGQPAPSKEEQAPAIAAAVGRLAEDKDVDLLALAKDPKGIDVAELEAKLMAREKELEAEARSTAVKRAEYWRHIGVLAFLQDTQKALEAYGKAVTLDSENPEGWRYLGELCHRVGDYKSARSNFEHMRDLGQRSGDAQAQSIALVRLCWIEQALGNLAEAERLAQEGLKFAESAEWLEGIARAYNALGVVHHWRSDLGKAEDMYLKSLELNEELGRKEGMAHAHSNLGVIYQTRGDLARAEEMLLKSLKLYEELGSKEGMAIAYGNLGNIYQTQGDLARAEQMQLKSLKLREELGSKQGMAATYGNLGVIYRTRGDLARAEEMQVKALKLNEELGSKQGMARAYGNLGVIYEKRGDLARAEEMQLKALKLNEELGSKQGMAGAYINLGGIYQTRGNLAGAEEMQLKALKLNEELGSKEGMAATYGNLGLIHQTRGDLDKAEEMQLEALKLNEELGSKEGMAATYGNLGAICGKQGNTARDEEMQFKALKLCEELGSKEGMANACRSLAVIYWHRNDKAKICEYFSKERDLWRAMGLEDKAAEAEKWLRRKGPSLLRRLRRN